MKRCDFMSKKLHIIMPMGGAGSRFFNDGFVMPKPLIEINGKPFLYWATKSIEKYINNYDLTSVVLNNHIVEFNIDKVILQYFPSANIVAVDSSEVKGGPILTCLAGVKNINDGNPIIFNDCDHMFRCSKFNQYINDNLIDVDGALLTFESSQPQFSYVKYNDDGTVCGTVEKKVVSNQAICGAYYVKNADIFKRATKQYLEECEYSEFFVSGVYNVLCKNNFVVKNFAVDFHVPFGTPAEYEAAQKSEFFKEFE